MITHVRQLDSRGCGVACLAMILNVSYHEARERLFGKRSAGYTTMAQINKEIRRAGIGTKYSDRRGPWPSLVPLTWPRHYMPGHGHFVVWDPANPKVYLDPAETLTPINDRLYSAARAIAARDNEPVLLVRVR